MNKLYTYKRPGALGAVMDLYEQEVSIFLKMINDKVKSEYWDVVVDEDTKDPDCKSIQTICQHIVGAADHYVDLMKKAEDKEYEMLPIEIELPSKATFEPRLEKALEKQREHFKDRWNMSDNEIEGLTIKTGWGNYMDPETLMEHAVVHIMRHHRQILRFVAALDRS